MMWGTMSEKNPTKQRRQCGTIAGYRKHTGNNEVACQPCRDANTEYKRKWREKQRMKAGKPPRPQVVFADDSGTDVGRARKAKAASPTTPQRERKPTTKKPAKKNPAKKKPTAAKTEKIIVADGGKKDGYPDFLRAAGRRMWDELREQYDFDPASETLLIEACRLKDRLERFAAALSSNHTLWFELGNVEETMAGQEQVQVVINNMIAEARQTQSALGQTLNKLGILVKAEKKKSGPSMADELKRKRQERLAAAREGA